MSDLDDLFIHYDAVKRFAFRLMPWCYEDLAHDTFEAAIRAWPPKHTEQLKSWLFRITRNTAINQVRRARRGAVHDGKLTPSTYHEDTALRHDLAYGLSQLSPNICEAFVCFYIYGESVREVSAHQHVAPITVSTRVFRAKKSMQACMGKRGDARGI